MLPKKLILIDYLTFEYAEIDFSKIRKALILGVRNNDVTSSNGAGKSNMLRSIPWCLWGINPDADNIDNNVRWGADFCSVDFEFTHNHETIRVVRTRNVKTNKSTLDLFINGVLSNGNSIADTTRKIIEKINLDYNAYVNSCYIKQNDIHSLANTEDKDKSRELFERLMGLDVYELYQEMAEKKLSELESERDELFKYIQANLQTDSLIDEQLKFIAATSELIEKNNQAITQVKMKIASDSERHDTLKQNLGSKSNVAKDYAAAKYRLDLLKTDLRDAKLRADRDAADLANKKSGFEKTISGESEARSESEKWEQTVADGIKAQARVSELDTKISTKRSEIDALQKSVASIEARVGILQHDGAKLQSEIQSIIAKINNPSIAIGSKCDSCLTDITENTVEGYTNHLNSDILKKKAEIEGLKAQALTFKPKRDEDKASIERLLGEISTLTVDKDALLKTIISPATATNTRNLLSKRIQDIEIAKSELAKINSSTDLSQWESTIALKQEAVNLQQVSVDDLAKSLDSTYEQDEAKIIELKSAIESSNSRVIALSSDNVLLTSKIDAANVKITEFDTIKRKVTENQTALSVVEKQILTYRDLVFAFSPKGIRYYILENAITELEREANEILPKLSQGNLRIRFETKKEIQKSKKGNQERLVFDAFINDGQKEQPFSSYSGGEQFRISFVIRVALSNLLLKRANTDLQFLVIDEAISPLDQAGIEMIIPTINELQNYFKVILVITHRSEVKQYFDEIITIKRNKYVSRIEA